MRDEILTSLAQLRDLNVRSRTSTRRYQKIPEELAAIGRELRVANVLEGSVQKAGDDVLINVQGRRADQRPTSQDRKRRAALGAKLSA